MISRFTVSSFALLLLTATHLTASSFELSGTVLDENGIGLADVKLTLIHERSGVVRTVTTNDTGHYSFPALPPGSYTLEARLSGYATSRYAGLRYFADTKPIFNFTLRPRAVQESMTFTGEAPLINVSQSQIGLSVDERQLRELPLKRRDYLELVALEGSAHELEESVPGEPVFAAPLQTVNGFNAHYTTYQLDGFENTRDEHGVVKVDVGIDAVEEFRVLSSQFTAEYGKSIAGIVSASTRTGGNDFHGSVFAFLRPGSWQASDPLTGEEIAFDRQELGVTFSGPIRRETTQFFANVEYRDGEEDVVVTARFDGGRFRGLFELPTERWRALLKASHLFAPGHRLTAKVVFADRSSIEGVGGHDIFANRLDTENEDWAVQGTMVSELGPALSELRFGLSSERFRAAGAPPPLGSVLIHPLLGNIGNPTRSARAEEDQWQVAETLSFTRGSHDLKTGFSFVSIGSSTEILRFSDGAFFFPPLVDAAPILFRQSFPTPGSPPGIDRDENHVALFFQDDWRLTPYVTLNLGLRWERESSVPDDDNFAPRLGFHWDATRDGRTSVRGGYGIFYSSVFSIVDSLERFFGPTGQRVVTLTPEEERFPIAPGRLSATAAGEPADLYVPAPELAQELRTSPFAQHMTLGLEREMAPTLSVSIDVSHIRGSDRILPLDLNAPSFFNYAGGETRTAPAADATRPLDAPGGTIPPGVVDELPEGFPFSGYRDLYLLASRGSSRFWGVKLNVTKRYAAELMLQAVYQWSRTRNDGDDFRIEESLPLDPANPGLEWGRSATDIPHSLVFNGVWDAPWGFRLAGLVRARSGRTVDARVEEDLDGDRKLRERPFDATGVILERNAFRAKAFATVDLSVSRSWELGMGRRIEAALDIFNLGNRLNPQQFLRAFGRDAASPLSSFLRIVQAAPPRQLQLSVRLLF